MEMKARSRNNFLPIKSRSHSKKKNVSPDSSTTSRSKFRGGGNKVKIRMPIEKTAIVTLLYMMMCVIYPGTGKVATKLTCPFNIESLKTCECKPVSPTNSYFLSLECQNINTTKIFSPASSTNMKSGELATNNINSLENQRFSSNQDTISSDWTNVKTRIQQIIITESDLECVTFTDFASFKKLNQLVITDSKVKKLHDCDIKSNSYNSEDNIMNTVSTLDLSKNKISSIQKTDFRFFPKLRTINLRENSIRDLEDVFRDLRYLEKLDLSFNQLDANLKENVLKSLSNSLTWLDIRNNNWPCSPELSWIYNWSKSLKNPNAIINASSITCHVENDPGEYNSKMYKRKSYELFPVMRTYTDEVLPSCPKKEGCSCTIQYYYSVTVYSVKVSCKGKQLISFPKLPKNTRYLDLTDNKIDAKAFQNLSIEEQNYEQIEELTLDKNKLESLPDKLLKMKLNLGFSVKYNKLTSISYELSQRLIRIERFIRLSNNSWECSCESQITDKNLMEKLQDKEDLKCGEKSSVKFRDKKITDILPEELCPPEGTGESQELLLKLLCGVLSISIVVVLTKLGYDYSIYRRRGQLPWLALKMP